MTTLPLWGLYLVTPLSAFAGVMWGQYLQRKGANELDVWRQREETMRMLRWASEEASSTEPTRARIGVAALDALSASELLQEEDQALVDAVIDALIEEPVEAIEQAGGDVDVVEVDDGPTRETLQDRGE